MAKSEPSKPKIPAPEPSKPKTVERQAFVALVQTAMRKHAAKQPLSAKESRAWARWETEENERRGELFVAAVPKKIYSDWSGRQTKTLHEQADAYGLPLRGATIDVPELIRRVHDFFAEHKHTLPAIARGEAAAGTPRDQLILEQIEVYRRRVTLLENKIDRESQTLLPRAEVHELLVQLAKVLRGAGERLHKQFGPQAASILDVALADFDSIVMRLAEAKTGEESPDLGDATPAND